MRITRTLSAAAALALACAALPAAAHEQIYSVVLTGPSEAPPNASPGLGVAIVTFDLDLFTMRLQTTFANLIGNVTAAHIHCCTAAPNAGTIGVATQLPSFSGFPLGGTFGSYDMTFDMTLLSSWNANFVNARGGISNAFTALLNAADNDSAYLNVHTSFAPGGEIRGFLQPVPEPGSWALMAAGLAAVAGVAVRRRAPG